MNSDSVVFQNTLFVFWDVESTSDDPNKDHIISLGAVLATFHAYKFTKMSEFHSYVSTTMRIDPVAQAVHNITSDMLKDAPGFGDMTELFRQWLQPFVQDYKARTVFLAHNGRKFDDVMLYCNFLQHRLDYESFFDSLRCWGFADTLTILKTLFTGKTPNNRFTLGVCYEFFCKREQLVNAHDALVDSNALYEIFATETVSSAIQSIQHLFTFVIPRAKALQWIKSTVAIEYERIALEIQHRKLTGACESDEVENENKPGILALNTPLWESGGSYSDEYRLCLGCVQFFRRQDQHQSCWSALVSTKIET